jgi:membrane-associated phospholipid phosphatase
VKSSGVKSLVRSAPPALPVALRRPLAAIAFSAAVVVAVLGVLFAGHSAPTALDARLLPGPDGMQGAFYYLGHVVDFCGEPLGSALIVLLLAGASLRLRRPRTAVLIAAGTLLTVGLEFVLKPIVDRTIHGGYLSYPSGHTAFATCTALVAALLVIDLRGLGRSGAVALILTSTVLAAAVMGWAEVGLGAHYPTDALGGFALALAVVPFTAWALDRLLRR